MTTTVTSLSLGQRHQAVAVLSAAFQSYPVMRYVIGDDPDFDRQLNHLIGFYVDLRYECNWPVLGISDDGELAGVALVNTPASEDWISSGSPALATLRRQLKPDAYSRLELFEEASAGAEPEYPHFFLGMLGVVPALQGRGYAHQLISHIAALSERDPGSRALVLTTEDASNHAYYERQGFTMAPSITVGDLTSCCFIRST